MTASRTNSLNHDDTAIRSAGLTRRFGALTAVDRLDLEVSYGEAFALVGPDAAGKTTTMRLLVGIMDPDEGQAEVLGLEAEGQLEELDRLVVALAVREAAGESDELLEVGLSGRSVGHRSSARAVSSKS